MLTRSPGPHPASQRTADQRAATSPSQHRLHRKKERRDDDATTTPRRPIMHCSLGLRRTGGGPGGKSEDSAPLFHHPSGRDGLPRISGFFCASLLFGCWSRYRRPQVIRVSVLVRRVVEGTAGSNRGGRMSWAYMHFALVNKDAGRPFTSPPQSASQAPQACSQKA
jgi:hypothetical protein